MIVHYISPTLGNQSVFSFKTAMVMTRTMLLDIKVKQEPVDCSTAAGSGLSGQGERSMLFNSNSNSLNSALSVEPRS